jgi:hypothetical protein
MAPQNKPIPTSSSMRSPLDPRYAEAMSNLYKGMKRAAAQGLYSQTDVEKNFSQFKRVARVLFSQGDNFITNYLQNVDPKSLSNAKVAKDFTTKVYTQLSGDPAQKAMNYAPGIIEGHHPVSVESTFQAGKHLIDAGRWDDFFEFQRVLFNEYGVGGTVAENQYPLSKFGHQGRGTRAKGPFPVPTAHTTANPLAIAEAEGFPVDTGTWGKEFNFSDITNPRKLAKAFMEQSGFSQMMMADKAMDSPQEIAIRNELAQKLGIRERELYSLGKDFKARGPDLRQLIKDSGIDVNEIVYRNYGLPVPERKPIPSRDPNAPKVPKTTKPAVVPTFSEAEQFAKGWFTEADFLPEQGVVTELSPAVTRSQSLGKTAAAIANREPLPTPKPAPTKQIRTEAEIDRIFANIVEAPKVPPVSGNFVRRGPVNITPTDRERALAAERANAGKTKAMSRSSGPTPAAQPVSQPKVGQSAILNGQAVVWNGGSWVRMPTPKAMKPTAKPKAAAQPTKPVRVIPSRVKPTSSRPPSSSASAGRRSLTIGQNPLSPLNRGSAASGAIERSTNDAIQDAPGWSPFWLKLAD